MERTHPNQSGLRILFADDEAHLRDLMQMELPRLGHEVTVCPDGLTAVKTMEKAVFDVAILDIRMPGLTGIEVLERARKISPETQVVLLTGQASVDTAVQALRLGAFDYLTKPCKWAELEVILNRVMERRDLTNKTQALETRLKAAEGGAPILVGETPSMQSIHHLIDTIAPTDASVLILGETGTGKELVARNLHEKSRRSAQPFIPVNCGALSENLVESELFGHRKGAFTGAESHRKGLFEVANGGTLFLDEVGELNKSVQVKLLRFLESGEIRRVGENDPFRVDVRVLCATNRDLRGMIDADQFREDLFFRVNTFEIRLPPLRERRQDLEMLVQHMLVRFANRRGQAAPLTVTPQALEALGQHDWPGNVRELANVIERATILAGSGEIHPEHLPPPSPRRINTISANTAPMPAPAPVPNPNPAQYSYNPQTTMSTNPNPGQGHYHVAHTDPNLTPPPFTLQSLNPGVSVMPAPAYLSHSTSNYGFPPSPAPEASPGAIQGAAGASYAGPHFPIPNGSPTLRDIEMKYIQAVLEKHSGNKPAAAKELGISLKTLYNKINQLQSN